ncbi:MAG: asparagine synthase (glutamine-hydrolyzing) [Rhodobacteraceae bacterium]|nr:asparagine synthase (glutamine-hydrolyzing) [Paracoccaceae bacterium]
MCGIAGLFKPDGASEADEGVATAMRDALTHRGPDAAGLWRDPAAGIVLAHRRLSIIDVSAAGAQPMQSPCGRYTLSYNGEIYNYLEMREELEELGAAPVWQGHSDTEVLLAGIARWGLAATLTRANGMFALALWDRETKSLTLARDRFGEKPLHVASLDGEIAFASELKALMRHPRWQGRVDRQAIAQCLRHGYIPAPRTAYEGVVKLAPGSCVTVSAGAMTPDSWRVDRYWDSFAEARSARAARFAGTGTEAVEHLDNLLRASVARQMISDVPLGAFLSGGIDSSTIAAMMQSLSATPVETFTLGFHDKATNEAEFAKSVATHLGTSHNEIYLSGDEARDLVETMPEIYDEPFADPSQLPTYLISRFARTKVTVSLSGDAADELFAGYGRYHSIARNWSGSAGARIGRALQRGYAAAQIAGLVAPAERLGLARIGSRSPASLRLRLEEKRARFATSSAVEAYERKFTLLDTAHRLVPGTQRETHPDLERVAAETGWSALEQASFLDLVHYLPDDILVKVDRAAMAHSLETRIPFLDPAVVRFALSLPDEIRTLGGTRKGLLKAVLDRYVPASLWDRPKRGFGIPGAAWLKGPLKPLAEEMFSAETLARVDVLDPALVRLFWDDFRAGDKRRANIVWAMFVVQLHLTRHAGR